MDHRIAEWCGLEGAFQGHLVQPPRYGQGHLAPQIRLPKGPSSPTVSNSKAGTPTASLGNLFQLDVYFRVSVVVSYCRGGRGIAEPKPGSTLPAEEEAT